MSEKFLKLPENIKPYITICVGFLIFLIIISFSLPIRWLASILGYFAYELCLIFGFSAIILEGKDKEIILLK